MSAGAKWTIRNIYMYLVCFVLLIWSIFAVSNLVYNLIGLWYPIPDFQPPIESRISPDGKELTPEMQKQMEVYQQKYNLEREKRVAVRESMRDGVMLILIIPLYLYHWRKIQSEAEPM